MTFKDSDDDDDVDIRNTASRNLLNIRGMSHMPIVSAKRIRDIVVSWRHTHKQKK